MTSPEPDSREQLQVRLANDASAHLPHEQLKLPSAGNPKADAYRLSLGYLGDIRLNFRFDGSGRDALVSDLKRLGISPAQALGLAVLNHKRLHGDASFVPLSEGVYALKCPDTVVCATFFLDRRLWKQLLAKYPEGVLVAVPREGSVLFSPATDAGAGRRLREAAARMLSSAGNTRISRNLYRFGSTGWQIAGPLIDPAAARREQAAAGPSLDANDAYPTSSPVVDPELIASGQRTLILGIGLGFLFNRAINNPLMPPLAGDLAWLALGLLRLKGVTRMSVGLAHTRGWVIALMVMNFVPLVNLLSWIVMNVRAMKILRAEGYRIGLLGAKRR
jgi:hypothetical protein